MKTLDLNAYGVQEMNHQEMVETDGGIIPAIVVGVIALGLLSGCRRRVEVEAAVDVSVELTINVNVNTCGC